MIVVPIVPLVFRSDVVVAILNSKDVFTRESDLAVGLIPERQPELVDPLVVAYERRSHDPEGRTPDGFPFNSGDPEILLVDPRLAGEQVFVPPLRLQLEQVAL